MDETKRTTQTTAESTPMLEALHAVQPDEALAEKLHLYGQFVGSWHLDIDLYSLDGSHRHTEGEVHFDWVLEGRAIQDTWIYPTRQFRTGETATEPWYRYGSTFRWYDPAIDAWHITWLDPSRAVELHQIGRAAHGEIVQVGEDRNGLVRRWRFVDITSESFTWLGEVSWDKGSTWTLETQMHASRVL
ncbi:hypothetical protein KDH_19830 [Dictyobacter sp. S3.2.2.5]|uniref:DUF1579 domain-containing protein n=1 Tax=Dictyobacter halimunensis TaxID=3026934 RepID=A0ABQ6FLN4_9CHLR|nr:hypothetical protein KDH_19830 [Dictyobacter sp. S3.2.2.5]